MISHALIDKLPMGHFIRFPFAGPLGAELSKRPKSAVMDAQVRFP
jgi:hypothetical protein